MMASGMTRRRAPAQAENWVLGLNNKPEDDREEGAVASSEMTGGGGGRDKG
jgi:hypothetical protein